MIKLILCRAQKILPAVYGERTAGFIFTVFFIYFLSGTCFVCFAETIYLENGRKVEGAIKELTDSKLIIEVADIPLEYGLDRIKRIDILGEGVTKKDVLDFIEAVNLMIADDIRDETQKEAEVMQLRLEDKPWHGYLVSEEERDLIARHRREIELFKAPPLCVDLKTMYLRWMLLREKKHDALYRTDWDQAENLRQQIAEYIAKINGELVRIQWLLRDEEVQRIIGSFQQSGTEGLQKEKVAGLSVEN